MVINHPSFRYFQEAFIMNIEETIFDTYQGHSIHKITLTNDNNVAISLLSLGATWHEFLVPIQDKQKNILLNFSTAHDYLSNPFYIGMAIGRTAGRIKNGTFPLNGQSVTVPTNEGQNTLHGGPSGFNTLIWDYNSCQSDEAVSITFSRSISHNEDGFPGDLAATVTYTLDNHNRVTLQFTGESNEDTLFNPTSHAYFNLSDSKTILGHQLMIASSEYLEMDSEKIPTGKLLPVKGTPFDFTTNQQLGDAIQALQGTTEKGFDDIYKITPNQQPIVKLSDPTSHRSLTISSSRNALVVFTSNSFTKNLAFNSGAGEPYMGIALESQTLPDTPNHPGFGDVVLPKNQKVTHTIMYQYSDK